ncbi:hypothetical protein GWK47_004209 [Chionoecetes opilio]|uniref:Uncharacterized protein n=1 Tax=Chionoecetes opilio TaxID=41210 RepID=A0A8J5CZ72_CHIOP|nr:hypothetical protein GWK47_004209 [Chionoecetes opilio]
MHHQSHSRDSQHHRLSTRTRPPRTRPPRDTTTAVTIEALRGCKALAGQKYYVVKAMSSHTNLSLSRQLYVTVKVPQLRSTRDWRSVGVLQGCPGRDAAPPGCCGCQTSTRRRWPGPQHSPRRR